MKTFNEILIFTFLANASIFCMEMPSNFLSNAQHGIEYDHQAELINSQNLYQEPMDENAGLIIACTLNDLELAEHLLQNNANPTVKNQRGDFALKVAVESKNIALIKLLLEYIPGDQLDSEAQPIIKIARGIILENEILEKEQENINNKDTYSIDLNISVNSNTSSAHYNEIETNNDLFTESTSSLNIANNFKRKTSSDQTQLQDKNVKRRKHTGEKPYPCKYPGCNESFSRLSHFKAHQKKHL